MTTDRLFWSKYIQRVAKNVRDRDRGHAAAERALSTVRPLPSLLLRTVVDMNGG